MAFLGKISAVVAANTSDFSRNIRNAKRDLMNFAASMRGIEFNLNTSALDKTLTKVQQFQAKIRSAQKLLAAGVDAGIPDLGKLQDKFRAVEDLGKPIASLVKQFEGFSTTIQAELLPELERAQQGFRLLYNDIDSGLSTFDTAGRKIDSIRRQIVNLRQAFAAAGDIGNLRKQLNIENVGASFFQPDAKEALQRSLKLRGEAENVPAKFRKGVFAQLAFQAEKNADVIEKQSARVAALQLEIARDGETPRRLERLAAAQERLNDAVAKQGQINSSFRDRLRVTATAASADELSGRFSRSADLRTQAERDTQQISEIRASLKLVDAEEVEAELEALKAEKVQIEATLKGTAASQLDELDKKIESLTRKAAKAKQNTDTLRAINSAIEAAESKRSALTEKAIGLPPSARGPVQDEIESVEASLRRLQSAKASFEVRVEQQPPVDEILAKIEELKAERVVVKASIEASGLNEVNSQIDQLQDKANLREAKVDGLGLQQQMAAELAPQLRSLQERAASLGDDGISQKIEGLRKNYIEMQADLQRVSEAATFDEASAGLDTYDAKLKGVQGSLKGVEAELKSAETSARRFQKFVAISGSGEDRLGVEFERAASDVAAGRQLIGNYEKEEGREGALVGLQKAIGNYEKLLKIQQKIADSNLGNKEKAAGFNKVTGAIKKQRDELVKLIAERSKAGGAVGLSEDRVRAVMDRNFKSRGSFNVAGMASAQLAMQQGLFAVDDFFSATGGFEYKLRAIGNNITQLGLQLGTSGLIPGLSATKGLAIGLGAVLAAQLIPALSRLSMGGKEAEENAKRAADAFRDLAKATEDIRRAAEGISDSISGQSSSELARRRAEREKQIDKVREARERQNQASLESKTTKGIEIAGEIDELQKKLATTTSPAKRAGVAIEIAAAKRKQEQALRDGFEVSNEDVTKSFADTGDPASDIIDRFVRESARGPNNVEKRKRAREAQKQFEKTIAQPLPRVDLSTMEGRAEAAESLEGRRDALIDLRNTEGLSERAQAAVDKLISDIEDKLARVRARDLSTRVSIDRRIAREAFAVADSISSARRDIDEAFGDQSSSSAISRELDTVSGVIAMMQRQAAESEDPREAAAYAAEIANMQAHADELKEAAMQVRTFASALDRVSQSIDSDVSSLQSRQEEARRKDILLGSPESAAQRERAKQDAEAAEAERRRVQADLDSARERFEQDAMTESPEVANARKKLEEAEEVEARAARRVSPEAKDDLQKYIEQQAERSQALSDEYELEAQKLLKLTDAFGLSYEEADKLSRARKTTLQGGGDWEAEKKRMGLPSGIDVAIDQNDRVDSAGSEDWAAAIRLRDAEWLRDAQNEKAKAEEDLKAAEAKTKSLRPLFSRRREIDEQLAKPVGIEGGTLEERESLRQERAALDAKIEEAKKNDPAIQEAERRRDAATRRAEEAKAADRGRQLGMSQLDRDRLAISAGVNDLRLAMSEELTDEGRQSLAKEGQKNLAKQFAPMVMQFVNERETALLKGPSRAALQASDVTTQQGQAELNRLLRGQDSNRDVNLAELQEQTKKLQEIVEAIRNSTGVVVDF